MVQRLSAFPTAADRWVPGALVATSVVVFGVMFYVLWRCSSIPIVLRFLLGGVAVLVLLTVGSLPLSYNELSDQGLTLRQGWYFRALVPYSNIKSVEVMPAPAGLWSPGVRRERGGKGLRVVMSRHNLIQLELEHPQQFVVFGLIPLVKAERVVLNVPEPGKTVQVIGDKIRP